MVCAKKSAASLAAAATSVYQSYSPSATATGASSPAGLNSTNVLAASSAASTTAAVSAANSGIKGFNYAAFFLDYSAKVEADFEYEFQRAQELDNTSGWTSARLYTMGKLAPCTFTVGRVSSPAAPRRLADLHWVSGA